MIENSLSPLSSEFQITYRYTVQFTKGIFKKDNPVLKDFFISDYKSDLVKKALVVLDERLIHYFPNLVSEIKSYFQNFKTIVRLTGDILPISGGEDCKNNQQLWESLVNAVDACGVDRHSYILAIGGGALLDLVGYVAAVSHRGIRLIRIPTTVLSQNDSGVGVKNSINHQGKKNFLGTFAPPVAVFNDLQFLETLDDRDWRSGMAEAIKVALIKDKDFFHWIEVNAIELQNRNLDKMAYLIHRCAKLHMDHIASGDPFEFGSSRPLDFGHWSAHKLEYLSQFSLRHGEAVAIGMALDTVYSYQKQFLSLDDCIRILSLLKTLGFLIYHPQLSEGDKGNLYSGLEEFREHLGGKLTIVLLAEIGKTLEVHEMDLKTLDASVNFLENYI
ncbi:3-dehydroquinate synthase [Leptospira sp. 2 VSF19]|uniref:3-dehydroquinate synthase n=1 Tax=Leptospira soteropolitanensis TaxID=2950025 RepID=A0AAW5VNH1_9LEPT|nr:3-dehydroquinate synthase [Leptospira soteropolitanensis]MCW7493607.1 3-dehydroquinate synthase [Leptospira soteropolitanensis]MCW7501206.1 3-dehydroquinate synthase [Leptospira soteropolitanensis]MCW7523608.1 3-dehydroquinate synthase [Leptospira soteropolitanensis]MCW7527319.1 3-dehydroquinate synthase [Leptospira soteropolitanensis]MCW7531176.1 3-dehydroquinate synthase [Leptospira soteropolitanensis]